MKAAGVEADAWVMDAHDVKDFVSAATTRHWEREASVRRLA